jgi:Cytochrome c554 and c-prime
MLMRWSAWLLLLAVLPACQPADDEPPALTREQLLNPESCKDCHPKYYREWSGSMHAYATKDPVFLAMNKRGQEETNNALGNFCVNCHAPMAVRENMIPNPADLSTVPEHLQGVTCYFCHNATDVGPDHFNATPITLANDTTMRADLHNAVEPTAHHVQRSDFHDAGNIKSSQLCGTCHDIVTPAPNNYHLERTFEEYSPSLIAQPNASFQSCQSCHMRSSDQTDQVATSTGRAGQVVPSRTQHEHLWAAVDVPLTDGFPNADAMRSAVESCELENSIVYFTLARSGPINFEIDIESQAGHDQPSGASHDRRLWVETTGYDANGQVVFSEGVVPDGAVEGTPELPHPFMLRDFIRDAAGNEVHMFWQATVQTPTKPGDSFLLPPATPMTGLRHYQQHSFRVSGSAPPVRFVFRMRMRPVGIDVLQDLVASGHLDPAVVPKMPTFTVTTREFNLDPVSNDFVLTSISPNDCTTYLCMLDPMSAACSVPP